MLEMERGEWKPNPIKPWLPISLKGSTYILRDEN